MNDTRLSMARMALQQLNRKDRLALLREQGLIGEDAPSPSKEVRMLRRHEVARRLSISLRAVDKWAKQGLLTKRILPGRVRACGFSSVEVERLILQGPPAQHNGAGGAS